MKMLSNLFLSKDVINNTPMLFPCGMSRSGTTLLSTVLDSHSQIALGYELIPSRLPAPGVIKVLLKKGLAECGGDFANCGRVLRQAGHEDTGLFITRSFRTGISLEDFLEVLGDMESEGLKETVDLRDRLAVACRVAEKKKNKESVALFGFKLNIPSVDNAHRLFPCGHYVYILRDPRDVVASHQARGFNRTIEQICMAWNNYLDSFRSFQTKRPNITALIRYEDLVAKPRETLERVFHKLPLKIEEEIFTFYQSNATVHQTGHPNADALRRDFFTTSVGRWHKELGSENVKEVQAHCSDNMESSGYT